MKTAENWLLDHLHGLRRALQTGMLLLLLLIPLLNRAGEHFLIGTLYSLKVGALDLTDPAMAMQTVLLLKQWSAPLILSALVPVLLAMVFGKVFGGWLCPFNFLAELGQKAKQRLFSVGFKRQGRNPNPVYFWMVLGIFILLTLATASPLLTYFSMPGQISGLLADLVFSHALPWEWLLVLTIWFVEAVVAKRWWCKVVCPVGAVLALPRSKYRMEVTYEAKKCNCLPEHRPCVDVCPLGLNPRAKDLYPFCYNCGECVTACRRQGRALNFCFGKKS